MCRFWVECPKLVVDIMFCFQDFHCAIGKQNVSLWRVFKDKQWRGWEALEDYLAGQLWISLLKFDIPFIHGSINRTFYAFKAVIFWGQIFATLWNCFIGEKLCFRVQCAYSANTNDIQFSSFSNPHYGLLLQFCSLKQFALPPAPSLYVVPLYVGRQLSKVVYLLSLDLPLNHNLCVA